MAAAPPVPEDAVALAAAPPLPEDAVALAALPPVPEGTGFSELVPSPDSLESVTVPPHPPTSKSPTAITPNVLMAVL